VQLLDPLRDGSVADESLDGGVRHGRCCAGVGLGWRIRDRVGGRLLHEPVPPNLVARAAGGLPVAHNVEEAVVSVAGRRRVCRVALRATDDLDRQAAIGAHCQGEVAAREGLVGDLALGGRVLAALTGVNDMAAVVLVVLVAALRVIMVAWWTSRSMRAAATMASPTMESTASSPICSPDERQRCLSTSCSPRQAHRGLSRRHLRLADLRDRPTAGRRGSDRVAIQESAGPPSNA
jgi:hypothetical protein